MNFRTFYENKGVDYDVFLQRMMGKEALIEKYLRIFMADTTYAELMEAITTQNFELAEFKAHTLKGIALNLNLEKLSFLCMELVNNLRSGNTQELNSQFDSIKVEYKSIIEGLNS